MRKADDTKKLKATKTGARGGRRWAGRFLILAGVLAILTGAGLAGYRMYRIRQSGSEAEQVLKRMEELIPGLGENLTEESSEEEGGTSAGNMGFSGEQTEAAGFGENPLNVLSVNGIDIVGCLEIPSINLRVPVTAKDWGREGFAAWDGGDPVSGSFRITGNENDALPGLAKAIPDDLVVFTDIDGVRYDYRVTSQFHLKSWAESDYDLMICYRTDGVTEFVLACMRAE